MAKDKSYVQYLNENLGNIGGIVSIGATTPEDSDNAFSDPNGPQVNYYTNGDSFSVHDNSALYEVIKIFKDLNDRRPEFQSVDYAIDVNNKRLLFVLVMDNDHVMSSDVLSGVVEFLKAEIEKKFAKTFEISSEEKDIFGEIGQDIGSTQGKKELRITVSEKGFKKEEPKVEDQ